MTISLEIDIDGARALFGYLKGDGFRRDLPVLAEVAEQLKDAIDNEDERRYDQHQERLMESGGLDDSALRRQLVDAGRGHLVR